jgi:hypothetical protein
MLTELRDATKSGQVVNIDKLKELALDGITLAGNASYELSMRRREELKQVINPMYRGLCSRNTPVSEMLFGKDMNNTMKQVAEAYKAGKKMTSDERKNQSSYRRYVPYNQQRTGKGSSANYSGPTGDRRFWRSSSRGLNVPQHSRGRSTWQQRSNKPSTATKPTSEKNGCQ